MGSHPHFTPDEFATRLARLRDHMHRAEVDVALFDEIEAMAWLTCGQSGAASGSRNRDCARNQASGQRNTNPNMAKAGSIRRTDITSSRTEARHPRLVV